MKLIVLGSGLMGPAAAYIGLKDPQVSQVTLCDRDEEQLAAAQARLADKPGVEKLRLRRLDLADRDAAAALLAEHDAGVGALPRAVIPLAVEAAAQARRPWIDLSTPPGETISRLRKLVEEAGILAIPGCGVEPGLTEIMARRAAEELDRVDELHIKCGGIPERPTGPLGYKIVFGGRRLPLRDWPAHYVADGRLMETARYSGVETFTVPGLGEVEAWHEGFKSSLLDLDAFKNLRFGAQKTVRWPGYAAKVSVLRELGLLGEAPVDVDGVPVIPKHVVDAVLYPHVRMEEGDRDVTVFRVEAVGERAGRPHRVCIDMLDRYDEATGFTSMARVTAFTGAIVALMAARGEIQVTGWLEAEKVIYGPLRERLEEALAAEGVEFV
ncbi:MAG: hypothetical protein D6790_04795, partial [Caldilineae bacterium]